MSDFVSSLHEVFERLGRIEARRMFGGHGIYHEGRMIGLVVADTLYLKTDAESVAQFDRLKLPAFEYRRGDKTMQTSYRQVPAEVFEDREEAAAWGRLAWEAAMRSGHAPKARRSRSAAGPKAVKTTKATKASKTATPNKTTKAAKTVKPAKTTGAPRKAAAR